MIHWFKKHPEFLREESKRLSKNPDYIERFQVRNNLFVSHGNIIVRLNKIYRFPILIVYTNATPYALPLIFPLKNELENTKVIHLSKLNIEEIGPALSQDIQVFFKFRHQNASGLLCILEWDNLDNGAEFYGTTTILKRIKEWFTGTITGEFPLDSQEVELYAHFNKIDSAIKFLYPEVFLNEELLEGDCYANLYGFRPKHKLESDQRLFFGCLFDGVSKTGIYSNYEFNKALIHPAIDTAIDLLTKNELVEGMIKKGELIKAVWFHINKTPAPFETVTELVTIIGNGSYDEGLARLANRSFTEIKAAPADFMIAIRFPNHKGNFEFQLFKLVKKNDPPGLIITGTNIERLQSVIEAYDFVEAIECEKLTETTFHERNGSRANHEILKEITVNFIGVGALGSDLADTIGKAGIGFIGLVDNQVFKAHNSIRHLAGFNQIGQLKVHAVAHFLQQHNPFLEIRTSPIDVLYHDISLYIEQTSLSVSTIADDNIEGFVNEQAVITQKDMFYVRALRGGKVGRIFRVISGKDACLNCLNIYRNEAKEFIDIPEDPLQPTIKNECNNPIRPASAADLKIISSIASRIIIDHLQDGPSGMNHWLWSTEDLSNLKKNQLYSHFLPVHAKCQYCNHDRKLKVQINKDVLSFMSKLVAEDNTIETGGVLIGTVDEQEGVVLVKGASGPGPKAKKTAKEFEKDVEYCQNFLDDQYKKFGSDLVYVGEWHSHPSQNNSPSGTDIRSLTEISYQKEYMTDKPIMIILSDDGNPSCTVHHTGKVYYHTDLKVT